MNCSYNDITELSISGDLRAVPDRRRGPTPIIGRYTLWGGRRRKARRDGDKKDHIFVDLYSTRLLVAVLFLLSLSCLDAFLTLELINKGVVYEANPVMAFFLDKGVFQFSLIKFTITSLSLIVMCLLKNVNITRICLPVIINIYLIVVGYELYLYIVV
jgi:hypothetical protein